MQQHNAAADVEDAYRGYDDGTYNPDLDTIVFRIYEIFMFLSTRAIHENIITVIGFLRTDFQFLRCLFLKDTII